MSCLKKQGALYKITLLITMAVVTRKVFEIEKNTRKTKIKLN